MPSAPICASPPRRLSSSRKSTAPSQEESFVDVSKEKPVFFPPRFLGALTVYSPVSGFSRRSLDCRRYQHEITFRTMPGRADHVCSRRKVSRTCRGDSAYYAASKKQATRQDRKSKARAPPPGRGGRRASRIVSLGVRDSGPLGYGLCRRNA